MTIQPACKSTRTTCPYCGVGCGVIAEVAADGAVSVRGDDSHPANFGRLCSKGSALGETLGLEGRLLEPEVDGHPVSWDQALDQVAQTFRQTIEREGPDSVAFYVSGQFLTEDYYVANKLMKGFIGSANIDTNSRLCMASSVAGHVRAFGSDTVPGVYEDLELADLIVLTGSNLAWCHPVLYQRIVAAKTERPQMRVVVIDPRRTVTCDIADLHLPLQADTDVALFLGLLKFLHDNGATDTAYMAAHTEGFAAALKEASGLDLPAVATLTGVDVGALATFYQWVAETEKTVTVYSQGVNQSTSGTDKVNAIINTHLATGRIGRPGAGPFSVTGQPNAMGGREVGGLANQLAAHMQIENPAHRQRVQEFWQAPAIADKAGLKAVDLFRAMADGRIKAVWIMATNPVDSLPDAAMVEKALEICPFVVVSDMLKDTDTARYADVLLPATGWGEKDGTVTNSERRISRQRAFLKAPAKARPDWWALAQVGQRMGWRKAFAYADAAAIFREHAALSAAGNGGARDFDIGAHAAISDKAYAVARPFHWPARKDGSDGATGGRLFGDGRYYTASGRANIVPVAPARGQPDKGLLLNTGRIRDQWHTMTRTGRSARLSSHQPEPFVEINSHDAAACGLDDGDLAEVYNQKGSLIVRALISSQQRPGSVFVPMHWTDQFASKARVNTLASADLDPVSGQPALKSSRVRIRPFAAQWYGFAATLNKPRFADIDYWAVSVARQGWRAELAGKAGCGDGSLLARRLFGPAFSQKQICTYTDESSGIYRYAAVEDNKLIGVLFVDRKPLCLSRNWVAEQMGGDISDLSILAGRTNANQPDPGPVVCACFGVGVNQITRAITEAGCTGTAEIGALLQAGTNCGSCLPEIRALLSQNQLGQAAE
ncbi:MAG: molybdopterin-dependent oxidoreductase [Rhodospirillales bacterium]|nr:molybdopterin-dependent oxidoreductase [Rhodospirillales bacterium]